MSWEKNRTKGVWLHKGVWLLLCLLFVIGLPSKPAEAAKAPSVPKKIIFCKTKDNYKGISYSSDWKIKNLLSSDKVSNIKSSNSRVVYVVPKIGYREAFSPHRTYKNWFGLQPLKAGTSVISMDVTRGKKVYHLKTTVKVYNYVNPLKSLKINGRQYAGLFNANKIKAGDYDDIVAVTKRNVKGTVKITAKSGWKIKKIWIYGNYDWASMGKSINKRSAKIKIKSNVANGGGIAVECYNKKTGVTCKVKLEYRKS